MVSPLGEDVDILINEAFGQFFNAFDSNSVKLNAMIEKSYSVRVWALIRRLSAFLM